MPTAGMGLKVDEIRNTQKQNDAAEQKETNGLE